MRTRICLFTNTVKSHHRRQHYPGNGIPFMCSFSIHSFILTNWYVGIISIMCLNCAAQWRACVCVLVCVCVYGYQTESSPYLLNAMHFAACKFTHTPTIESIGFHRFASWMSISISILVSRFFAPFCFPLTRSPFVIFQLSVHQNMHQFPEKHAKPKSIHICIQTHKRKCER